MEDDLDQNKPLGPNVKRLLAEFAAVITIPQGSANPMVVGIAAFASKERILSINRQALQQVEAALEAMKAAPDNPYGDDDEGIAGAILERVEGRRKDYDHLHQRCHA